MRKTIYLLLAVTAFLTGCGKQAASISKQTELYAVKGADSLYLDRYTVAVSDKGQVRPCLLFVFGGGFVAGERDAEQYLPFFEHMVERGYDVVSIDYRLGLKKVVEAGDLSPEAMMLGMAQTVAMAVEDLYDATAFVVERAQEWGVDASQIVACGSSAGAVTVLRGEYDLCNDALMAQLHLPEGFRYAGIVSFAGAIFEMDKQLVWKSAPAPMMLFHGDADSNVPYDVIRERGVGFFGSKYIAGQLRRMEAPYYFYSVEGASHLIATTPMDERRDAIESFLTRQVAERQPLMLETVERTVGMPEVQREFSLADYISANFM
ncbi:MAG: alpha/beta hydrolase [Alistipes sp.]|nr:alpha/beta hydrolase [Alistipes sp.]